MGASPLRHHCVSIMSLFRHVWRIASVFLSLGRLWEEAYVVSCSLRVFSLADGPPCPGGTRVTRTGSGGQLCMCFCMFHIHSLGTLHNPIGAVALWCYIYTATSHIHRMYAGCLEYYTLIRRSFLTGRTCVVLFLILICRDF